MAQATGAEIRAGQPPLRVASRVMLVLPAGECQGSHSTYVEDITPSGPQLALPDVGGRPVHVAVGETVSCSHDDGVARYSWTTTVAGLRAGVRPSLVVRWPERYERLQRRAFFRVPVLLPVIFAVRSPNGRVSASGLRGHTRDLGGGGISLVSPVEIPVGAQVGLELELHPGEAIACPGRVVRLHGLLDQGLGWQYGVQFLDIDPAHQEAVVRRVVEEQRVLARAGLLRRGARR